MRANSPARRQVSGCASVQFSSVPIPRPSIAHWNARASVLVRQLDKSQKDLISQLTLKKRQSKKSTMSEKQLAAKQQLAKELLLERIIPVEDSLLLKLNDNFRWPTSLAGHQQQSQATFYHHQLQHQDRDDQSSVSDFNSSSTVTSEQPSTSSSLDSSGCSACRLEQLNEELERKLYQYEYLVTKEKALLNAYNMVLFTNEGVNNFYVNHGASS